MEFNFNMLEQLENKIKVINSSNCNDVLIVDDNQFNILTLESMLDEFSIRADHAYDGQEGID